MDIKLLRAFVTLSQLKRYHSAAEKLCVTQPALTKQIQTLESLSGITLFQRGRHGARLTVAGELLLQRASEVLESYDNFRADVASIQQGIMGKLTVGFGISSFRVAPEKVAIFRTLYPDVQVSLNDMSSAVQFQKLAEGQLQTGFVRLPAPERLESKVLAEEKLVLAVAHERDTELSSAAELLGSRKLLQLSRDRGEGLSGRYRVFFHFVNSLPRQSFQQMTSRLFWLLLPPKMVWPYCLQELSIFFLMASGLYLWRGNIQPGRQELPGTRK